MLSGTRTVRSERGHRTSLQVVLAVPELWAALVPRLQPSTAQRVQRAVCILLRTEPYQRREVLRVCTAKLAAAMKAKQHESMLRATAMSDPMTVLVLADFYEEHGQPTRAELWRAFVRIEAERGGHPLVPPDLRAISKRSPFSKTDQRRNAMIALLSGVTTAAKISRAFQLSSERIRQIIHKYRRIARWNDDDEQKHVTMMATHRLTAAGALGRPDDGGIDFDDIPPDTWPATSRHEIQRLKQRNKMP